jgi:hypothetical protein
MEESEARLKKLEGSVSDWKNEWVLDLPCLVKDGAR